MHDKPAIIAGKDLERCFYLHQTLLEVGMLFEPETNDRAIAIVGAAFLDTLLEPMLVNFLVDDEKEVQRLLQHNQSMGTCRWVPMVAGRLLSTASACSAG